MLARTTVTLLEPQLVADEYDTSEQHAKWTLPPVEHRDVPAAVDPLSSTEAVLTSGTVVSRWTCYLPGGTRVASSWRVRWRGLDYDIDGEVMVNEGTLDEFQTVILKRVSG